MEKKLFISVKDEPARMFKNPFLERCSQVHFTTPLFVFIPIIAYFTYLTVVGGELPILYKIGYFISGILGWTVAEYAIHRWVFHFHPTSEWGKVIHFYTHGVHHDYPQDSTRLVMPPGFSLPLAVVFYFGFRAVLGSVLINPIFAGFVLGYLVYDMTHYAVHHLNWKNKVFRSIKKHHMDHHYKNPDAGYGFTSKVWDKVFRTDFK